MALSDFLGAGVPAAKSGHVKYYPELIQGSEEWLQARLGLLTASEMKFIVTPPPEPETRIKKDGTLYKQREWDPIASNDKERAHLYELLAQRITRYIEPRYISDDMLRGKDDEIEALAIYHANYAPVEGVGFITNDRFGFTIGYSPDGLVGNNGLIECKSRLQKYQIETILNKEVPADFVLQIQTGLLVSEREWLDFVSYSGGMLMITLRVYPDPKIQRAIVEVATAFEERLAKKLADYETAIKSGLRLIPTVRRIEQEIMLS